MQGNSDRGTAQNQPIQFIFDFARTSDSPNLLSVTRSFGSPDDTDDISVPFQTSYKTTDPKQVDIVLFFSISGIKVLVVVRSIYTKTNLLVGS